MKQKQNKIKKDTHTQKEFLSTSFIKSKLISSVNDLWYFSDYHTTTVTAIHQCPYKLLELVLNFKTTHAFKQQKNFPAIKIGN